MWRIQITNMLFLSSVGNCEVYFERVPVRTNTSCRLIKPPWELNPSLSSVDSMSEGTHKGKFMENIEEIDMEDIRNIHKYS